MISDNSPLSELIYFRNDFFSQECPVSLFSVPYNSVLSKVPPYMAIGDIAEFYFHFQKKKIKSLLSARHLLKFPRIVLIRLVLFRCLTKTFTKNLISR